jgi:very-short-patch-repair endonuclease
MEKCIFCNKELKPNGKSHQIFCHQNPNKKDRRGSNNPMFGKKSVNQYSKGVIMSDETKAKISSRLKQQKPSLEKKKKTSESMKKAHAEGRAWNIGMSRWNNKKSYPELFFSRVIENEFSDKNYISEFPLHIYSIDFAWPEIKKGIEIDGSQHKRFEDYLERDKRKDLYAKENGWEILRISWDDLFSQTKHWIKIAYDFIH